MRSRIRFAVGATLALAGVFAAAPAAHAALVIQDLDTGASADGMAQQLAGQGVSISNVVYTGANRAAGTFSGGDGIIGFGGGVILDSGNARTDPTDSMCSTGVEGPNNCNEDVGGDNSFGFGTPGDANLTALSTSTGGGETFDASILEFDFVPAGNQVTFQYVFSSDEYNNFSNTSFNDVFAFFVNGTNCATVPGTGEPVSINTINNGNPGGDSTPHNPQFFIDNVRPTPGTIDTQMDGLTTVLTCTANVNAGQSNHMKLAIADASDSALDSAVFIQAGSLTSTPSGLELNVTGRKKQKPIGPQLKPSRAKNDPGKILSVRVTCANSPCTVKLKGSATAGGEKAKFKAGGISLQSDETRKVRLSAQGQAPLAQLKGALKGGANGSAKVKGTATAPNGDTDKDNFKVKLRGR
jgi:hypothetical protein